MVGRRIARLPAGISWEHLAAAGILAGIGFTMSIFIAMLAFSNPVMQDISKLSILVSSVLSILFVLAWMRFVKKKNDNSEELSEAPNVHHLA